MPPPPPVTESEVSQLISNCIVDNPFQYRELTIFPLILRRELDLRAHSSLDEAFQNRTLEVYETGTVAEVRVVNRGRQSVFGMAGEILVGGKQNRMLSEDVLIPGGSEVRVPVYCVEKGRWEGDIREFQSRSSLTLPGLRSKAASGAPQDAIWEEIAESRKRLSVESKTEDFQAAYEHEAVRKEMDDFHRGLRPIWRRPVAGMVICRYGQIVGAEIFGGERLFSKLQQKILDSYFLDYLHHKSIRDYRAANSGDVRRFLDAAHRARLDYGNTPGEGRAITLSGAASGKALSAGGVVVHLSLFTTVTIMDR